MKKYLLLFFVGLLAFTQCSKSLTPSGGGSGGGGNDCPVGVPPDMCGGGSGGGGGGDDHPPYDWKNIPSIARTHSDAQEAHLRQILTEAKYKKFFSGNDIPACNEDTALPDGAKGSNGVVAKDYYTYENFIKAASYFPDFANSGDDTLDQIELAAFFGESAKETFGGWGPHIYDKDEAPIPGGGMEHHGYCFIQEHELTGDVNAAGFHFNGRGPLQLTHEANYKNASKDLFGDESVLDDRPYLLAGDGKLGFMASIHFWMTSVDSKPSIHDVFSKTYWHDGQGASQTEKDKGRTVDKYFAVVTDIINGGYECGSGKQSDQGEEGNPGYLPVDQETDEYVAKTRSRGFHFYTAARDMFDLKLNKLSNPFDEGAPVLTDMHDFVDIMDCRGMSSYTQ